MKAHNIILNNEHYPLLEAENNTGNSGLKLSTGDGYIMLGPLNTGHAHIETDRSNFYFNKELRVDSGVIGSYNEDLYLRRASNSSHQIQITTTDVITPLNLDIGGYFIFSSQNHSWTASSGGAANNILAKIGTTGAGGIALKDSQNNFKFQIYGNGTNYGFLDGDWANWDLKKTTNGKLTFNGNDTYFLQPEHANSAKFRQYVQIGDSSNYNSNSGTWGARLNVTDDVHAKIEVGQDANSMLSHWYAHTGQSSIKFGTSSSHDVEFQRAGSTLLELEPGGLMTMVPIRRNSHHASGFLEGSYNNVGSSNNAASNPIYTIGSSYNPAETTLSNMYGVGFSKKGNATFLGGFRQSGWGMYVASDGDARVFLNAQTGVVASTGGYDVGAINIVTGARTLQNVNIDAGLITSGTIPEARLPTQSKYLRSDTSDAMSGELNVSRNGGVTGTSAPQYSDVNIELQTSSNHVPGISFHRGGYSATTLYEYDGELHVNPWVTRAQQGKLISSGNYDDYVTQSYVNALNINADTLDSKDHTNFGATLATYGTTASGSGRIRCTAPFNTNSAHMFQITVSIYSSYTCHSYVVSGYMYPTTNQWYLPKCVYTGTGTPDIKVGRDSNGKAYISIANGNYTGVRVHNMTRGYQTSLADTYDPWTITIDAGTENSVTPTTSKVWHSTNDGSGSGLDADTVDGVHEDTFMRKSANSNLLMNFNKILGANGTAAAPSYTFNSDQDSGIFRIGSNAVGFSTGGTQRFKINSNGLLLTGSSSLYVNGQRTITNSRNLENIVNITNTDGYIEYKRTGAAPAIFNRLGTGGASGTSRGEIVNFKAGSSKVGRIGYAQPYGGMIYLAGGQTTSYGVGVYQFSTTSYFQPCTHVGADLDDVMTCGNSAARWTDVYSTNGTIQTSDRNEKQDIQALTDAETRVATACKGLIRRYRWISSVEEKGDNARYHFGAIAQDVEDAFTAEGLNAGDYALFIKNHWWEHEGTSYPTAEAAPTGAVEKTRLGIRYNQLLAFIISAL